jgi:competence protein ComEC
VVISPGFEMSFCATASLVALAEVWPHRHRAADLPWSLAALQMARDWTIGMLMVSFVAGAATTPFSIQHFNRIANYGMFANLTADLLAAMVLMPALTLSVLLQALGVSHAILAPLLVIVGVAAEAIVAVGHLFSNLPGAKLTISSAPTIALIVSYLGIVFACLWRGRLRWLGVPLSCAVAFWPRPAPPAAWIASDGGDAAVAIAGKAVALKPDTRAYAVQTWAQRRGFDLPADPVKAQAAIADCNRLHCAPVGAVSPAIAAWWTRRKPKPDALGALCKGADILILKAEVTPPDDCAHARVLGPGDFAKGGAAEVFPAAGAQGRAGWRLVWSQPLRGQRPWAVIRGSGE